MDLSRKWTPALSKEAFVRGDLSEEFWRHFMAIIKVAHQVNHWIEEERSNRRNKFEQERAEAEQEIFNHRHIFAMEFKELFESATTQQEHDLVKEILQRSLFKPFHAAGWENVQLDFLRIEKFEGRI
ncbi:hypothetical protein [Donghicola eburneus]|uniref:Uncharacterized protein n=1 Tax=Donghicola eburneus TaxID=393278 RepID=A0A1M4N488_9RHOB|nr:hypothetical protein [Donghicola eburneus]SCM69690.1 hypothetical protein KARMA_3930 [Donghicola eburneus]